GCDDGCLAVAVDMRALPAAGSGAAADGMGGGTVAVRGSEWTAMGQLAARVARSAWRGAVAFAQSCAARRCVRAGYLRLVLWRECPEWVMEPVMFSHAAPACCCRASHPGARFKWSLVITVLPGIGRCQVG